MSTWISLGRKALPSSSNIKYFSLQKIIFFHPPFSFLREHVSNIPGNLKLVHDSSVYSDVLDFIDPGETFTEIITKRFNSDECGIDPIAVSMLEVALGEGYANAVDDNEVFQTLMRSNKKKIDFHQEPNGGLAVISPIYKSNYASATRWRERGIRDVEFTHGQFIQKFPLYKDFNKENAFKDILKTFEKHTGKNKKVSTVNSAKDESNVQEANGEEKEVQNCEEQKLEVVSVWDSLHGVLEGIQERFILGTQKINRNTSKIINFYDLACFFPFNGRNLLESSPLQ